jgi:hypothetical protein
MKTIQVSKFLGMNNRLPDTEMRVSTKQMSGQWLRSAVNVEVDDSGQLRRRNGTSISHAIASPHSLFKIDETHYFMGRASGLYAVTLPTYTEVLVKALTNDDPISYAQIGADTYYSNGTDSGRVTAGVAYPMGLPTPSAPAVTDVAGSLLPGLYRVCVSYSNNVTGEEGGVSPATQYELPSTGTLRVTLPAETTGATHINIYVSGANGGICLWVGQVTADTVYYDMPNLGTGREAPQRYEIPLPAGTLFASNGRLCSFISGVVSVGLPFKPGYCDVVGSWLPFEDDVAIAVENQGGTYIATTAKTYFFPGDLGDVQGVVTNPVPHGAVPGTAFTIPDKNLVGWFGTLGVVLADTQGQVTELMNDNIDLTHPASGHSVVFQSNGFQRVVSCGWSVNTETKATTQYEGWDFTSVAGEYGTKADGIYSLNATELVPWSYSIGKTNFGPEELKHLPNVYIDAACATQIEMTVGYVDERGEDREYTYLTRGACENLKTQRFDTGRGIRSSRFDLSFGNPAGDEATIVGMSFAQAQSTRRI